LTLAHGQDLQPIFEQEDDEGPEDEQEAIEHPRLRHTIQWDHPIDNILGGLRKGAEQALGDPDWVMDMQEELNNSKETKCGLWWNDPIPMSLAPGGSSATSKMRMEW